MQGYDFKYNMIKKEIDNCFICFEEERITSFRHVVAIEIDVVIFGGSNYWFINNHDRKEKQTM